MLRAGGGGQRAVSLRDGNRFVEEEGSAGQPVHCLWMGTWGRGTGPVGAGGPRRTPEFRSSPEERAVNLGEGCWSREGESTAARWRIRGADERAWEPAGEGAGPLWSRLCPPIQKSPQPPRPTCLESLLGADPAACPRSRVREE